jgi:hypothetical protein
MFKICEYFHSKYLKEGHLNEVINKYLVFVREFGFTYLDLENHQ